MDQQTRVTVTGTGTPLAWPGLAGPGVLVESRGVALQFDAGRATVLRLAEVGCDLTRLAALFITHHHSDHLVGVADLLMTRWLEDVERRGQEPLPVVVPEGEAATIVEHVLDVWRNEIELRARHTGRPDHPVPDVHRFDAAEEPVVVFAKGEVTVSAVAVEHAPVVPAVAYRIDTPDGAIVISGDTRVCASVERLAGGASVLVHEAFRVEAAAAMLSDPEAITAYHADTLQLGAMAARAGVETLVLTHLIPPLRSAEDKRRYEDDIRFGGYTGRLVVADDLTTIDI